MARSFSDEEVTQYAIPAPTGVRSFSDEDIAALEVKPSAPEKSGFAGFFPGVGRAYQDRKQRQVEALGRSIDNEQALGSGLLQAAGEGAGFLLGDVPLEAIRAVTPDFIEKPVGEVITAGVKKAASLIPQGVKDTIAEHPEAARNAEATLNLASLIPGGAVAGTGAKTGTKLLTGTVKTVAEKAPTTATYTSKRAAAFSELFNSTVKTRRDYNRILEKGHDVAQTLASDDRFVPTGKNGGITEGKVTPDAQIAQIQSDIDAVAPMIRQVIESENKYVPLATVRSQVMQEIAPLKVRGDEYNRILANVNRDLDFYEQTYGRDGMIPLTILDDIKKEKYKGINWNNPDLLTADRSIARAARKTIEGEVTDISVANLNRELGKLYDAQEMLESLAGRAVKGGRLGKHFGRVIGVGLGSSGGLTGAFFGGVFADRLVDAMQSASFGNPMMKALVGQIKRERPDIFRKAEELLAKRKADQSSRLQLPPPSYIPMGAAKGKDNMQVFDDYDAFLKAQGIQRAEPDMLQLPAGNASPINQGRAIPLLPRGSSIEVIGPGVTGGRYVPPSPAPKGTPTKPITPDEPYIPTSQLPVIDAGKRTVNAGVLPTAKDAPKVFAPEKTGGAGSYFHATTPENAAKIRAGGFAIPEKEGATRFGRGVYLASSGDDAKIFMDDFRIHTKSGDKATEVIETRIKPDAKIYQATTEDMDFLRNELADNGHISTEAMKDFMDEKAAEAGVESFDGIFLKKFDTLDEEGFLFGNAKDELVIFNKDALETKAPTKKSTVLLGSRSTPKTPDAPKTTPRRAAGSKVNNPLTPKKK